MEVPNDVDSLSSMEFSDCSRGSGNSMGWELVVLYGTIPLEKTGTGDAAVRSYSLLRDRSRLRKASLMFYRPPINGAGYVTAIGTHHTFDSAAEMERQSLSMDCHAFLQSSVDSLDDAHDSDDDDYTKPQLTATPSPDDEIKRIDGWYMKRLFRPAYVRAIDGCRPSDTSVRRAMDKLFPNNSIDSRSTDGNATTQNIEMETILAVKEWARADEAKANAQAARRRRRTTSANAMDGRNHTLMATPGPRSERKAARKFIYHAFRTDSATEGNTKDGDGDEDCTDETMEDRWGPMDVDDGDDGNNKEGKMERRIVGHHERWRSLLFAVGMRKRNFVFPYLSPPCRVGQLTMRQWCFSFEPVLHPNSYSPRRYRHHLQH